MNPDDIHIGDIAVTKDGTEYRIVDVKYNTVLPNNKIYLDLSPIDIESVPEDYNGTYGFQYAWAGHIDDLKQSFDKIGERMLGLDVDKEKLMEQYEEVSHNIDNAFRELSACGNALRELRKMTLELLNKKSI